MKPLLLDLFCGAGGCSRGYADAGFQVVGCDLAAQPRYPYEFYQDDALACLDTLLSGKDWHGYRLSDFAAIHASPVCKGYTVLNGRGKEKHQKLIPAVRERLQRAGVPYIIENVAGAKKELPSALWLCGSMFGLPVRRHRLFESSLLLFAPRKCNHKGSCIGVYGHSIWDYALEGTARKDGTRRPDSVPLQVGRDAMGIDWMGIEELAQAIPPAFTRWIGQQLIQIVRVAA